MHLAWFSLEENKTYHTCMQCRPFPFIPFPGDTIIIAEEKSLWDSHPHLKLCFRCRHRQQNRNAFGPCTPTNGYDLMEREIRAKYPNTSFHVQRI